MPINLAIFYRNFQLNGLCHVGLGVNALHTAKVLRRAGIAADAFGVKTVQDIRTHLAAKTTHPLTHALIEAPWVSATDMLGLMRTNPLLHFASRVHSQIGFLQVEPGALTLIRDYTELEAGNLNFHLLGNSTRFCDFVESAYNVSCRCLPNLYVLEPFKHKRPFNPHSDTVKIGSFGAFRLLKNHTTSAAAAMILARRGKFDLEFHVSKNREEHGKGIDRSLAAMFRNLPWAKLVEHPWSSWPNFRETVAAMDLCLQPSFTETFNLVTADAVAEGVPSVVSDAIDWAPPHWKANVDDAEDIARAGMALLHDWTAAETGYQALKKHVVAGTLAWKQWLTETLHPLMRE